MICHHYKCIFVHIPKTAGQSVEHVFLNLLGLTWETRAPLLLRFNDNKDLGPPRLAHLKAGDYLKYKYISEELFNAYFKFSFVRNPWSRIVSFYNYRKYYLLYSFKSFVMKHLERKIWKKDYWFIGPQYEFLYDNDGKILVDFVGKFENLQTDFNKICSSINIIETKLPHINKSNSNSLNNFVNLIQIKKQKIKKHYPEYYDKESEEHVRHLYKKDIDYFKYDFIESENHPDTSSIK